MFPSTRFIFTTHFGYRCTRNYPLSFFLHLTDKIKNWYGTCPTDFLVVIFALVSFTCLGGIVNSNALIAQSVSEGSVSSTKCECWCGCNNYAEVQVEGYYGNLCNNCREEHLTPCPSCGNKLVPKTSGAAVECSECRMDGRKAIRKS